MAKQSTNKWALERARKSANLLLKKAGIEPLLVEVLSDLLWVVDHQQDELERMREWVKHTIEQALVDHARGDGTVQINETCHQAIKDWYYTEPVEAQAGQPAQEINVGSDAPMSDERLAEILAANLKPIYRDAIKALLSDNERLRAREAALVAVAREVAEGDVYHDSKGGMLVVAAPDALLAKARALLGDEG